MFWRPSCLSALYQHPENQCKYYDLYAVSEENILSVDGNALAPWHLLYTGLLDKKSKKVFHMFISMNLINFNFKKEKGKEAFSVKVPSLLERPKMIQRFFGVFALSIWGDQEHNSFEMVTRMPHVRQWNAPHTHTHFQIVNWRLADAKCILNMQRWCFPSNLNMSP